MAVLKRIGTSEDGGVAQFAWEYGSEAVEPFLVLRHRLFCAQAAGCLEVFALGVDAIQMSVIDNRLSLAGDCTAITARQFPLQAAADAGGFTVLKLTLRLRFGGSPWVKADRLVGRRIQAGHGGSQADRNEQYALGANPLGGVGARIAPFTFEGFRWKSRAQRVQRTTWLEAAATTWCQVVSSIDGRLVAMYEGRCSATKQSRQRPTEVDCAPSPQTSLDAYAAWTKQARRCTKPTNDVER
ncbi:uncharacterized protein EMH_0070930 [Eimeria mitis]|uniref:Uncharacterized protein n=1 Tax=Eimeria mitis TaxID=44415 RepID=U6K4N8_9EIME|nr:uncharacterized protein EMH_0070930 [Eimeria mitis]CDJ31921.1 hypothetical protein EMH_0070930 [Eimeria mitis]